LSYGTLIEFVQSFVESSLRKLPLLVEITINFSTHIMNRFTSVFLAGFIASVSALGISQKADANAFVSSFQERDSYSYHRDNDRHHSRDNDRRRYGRDNDRDNNRRYDRIRYDRDNDCRYNRDNYRRYDRIRYDRDNDRRYERGYDRRYDRNRD
jgi:hypothetical protein